MGAVTASGSLGCVFADESFHAHRRRRDVVRVMVKVAGGGSSRVDARGCDHGDTGFRAAAVAAEAAFGAGKAARIVVAAAVEGRRIDIGRGGRARAVS